MAETVTRWQRWWYRLTKPFQRPVNHEGLVVESTDGVQDGVDYTQPHIVPAWVRRNPPLFQAEMQALRESAASKYRSQFGEPFARNMPIAMPIEDPLQEWPRNVREMVVSNCHAAQDRNPVASAIVRYTTLFVVGDGFNLIVKNKDVEQVLLDFIDNPDNNIREYERQAVSDLQTDGELILRLFVKEGQVAAAPQRPWELDSIKTESGFSAGLRNTTSSAKKRKVTHQTVWFLLSAKRSPAARLFLLR